MVASPPVVAGQPRQATELADRLHSAAIHLLRRLRRTDPMTGVSAAQLSALSVLMGGRRTISELASAEQVQVPTMSRLLRQMEEAGLVERQRDPDDQRVVWIGSTKRGQEILARGRELRVSALTRAIAELPAHDRRTLAGALELVDRLLERL